MKLRDQVFDEAFKRNNALLRAERIHYQEEIDRQNTTQTTLSQSNEALENLKTLHGIILCRIKKATPEDKRWVLQILGVRVTARLKRLVTSLEVPSHVLDSDLTFRSVMPRVAAPRRGHH